MGAHKTYEALTYDRVDFPGYVIMIPKESTNKNDKQVFILVGYMISISLFWRMAANIMCHCCCMKSSQKSATTSTDIELNKIISKVSIAKERVKVIEG